MINSEVRCTLTQEHITIVVCGHSVIYTDSGVTLRNGFDKYCKYFVLMLLFISEYCS